VTLQLQTLNHINGVTVDLTTFKYEAKKDVIRVLHVDDDLSILEISKQILTDIDGSFEIDHACCVDEAFGKLAVGQYDVAVSDYEMPKKDGLQFLKELREQKNGIPFILFTGKGREEVAIRALNMGADGYHNKQGSPETVYGELVHGINLVVDRSKAKQALEESEKRYHALMEQASETILIHDIHGRIIDANQRACIKLGYAKEELVKLAVADIDIEGTENKKGLMWSKVLTGETFVFESTHKRKDGTTFPVDVSLGAVAVGKEILVIGIIRDISERKKAEMELKQKYSLLEKVSESVGAGLAIIGRDYHIVWANKILRDIGADEKKKCYHIFNGSDCVCTDCGVQKIFEQNAFIDRHEYKIKNPKGKTTWIELIVTPVKDENGNVVGALELAVPITELKQAQEELLSLVKFSEENPDPVLRIRKDGYILYANFACKKLAQENPVKAGFFAPDLWRMKVANALSSKKQIMFEEMHNHRIFLFKVVPIVSEEYANLYGIDITELKKAQDCLEKSE
jgi:PAS domain S-box-containing protein